MLTANLMEEIVSDEVLQQAFRWLCKRRKDHHQNNDVWTLRWRWREVKTRTQAELLAGRYRFETVERVAICEEMVELWSARDALVLKATAIVLSRHLASHLPQTCYHPAGHGGAKAAVRDVAEQLPSNTFVFRSDVKSYYASIDHDILFVQLEELIADPRVLELLRG